MIAICLTVAFVAALAFAAYIIHNARLKHEFNEARKHETELSHTLNQLYEMIHADLQLHGSRIEITTAPLSQAQARLDERLKTYEAALTNFVTECRDVVKYSEDRRREAAQKKVGQVMPGQR